MNTANPTALSPAAESAINRIKAEHRALACMLGAIQVVVSRYHDPAAAPDFELLESMLRYIENVPDRLHHPKEDRVLFPAVVRRAADGQALVRELERDHARRARMLAELRVAFEAFCDGGANALNRLATAVEEFTEFYLNHMRREEEQLLPLATATLSQEDWQRVDDAFGANVDPLADATLTDEFRRLYDHITEMTPRPLKALLESAAIKSSARDQPVAKEAEERLLRLCCYATSQVSTRR